MEDGCRNFHIHYERFSIEKVLLLVHFFSLFIVTSKNYILFLFSTLHINLIFLY